MSYSVNRPRITFSFDIGHASIGWAALEAPKSSGKEPEIIGTGTVIFPAEDCQNQQRAGFRRQRRNIAATRNRIKRLALLIEHLGAMKSEELKARHKAGGGHSFPWLLAAKVMVQSHTLSWPELWDVLRWYSHNRGYDGNALWATNGSNSNEDEKEDTEKVTNALNLMSEYGTTTMSETVCSFLGLDPCAKSNPAPKKYFKGSQAAFPRHTVVNEVRRILEHHEGKLSGLSKDVTIAILDDWKVACDTLGVKIHLPGRYQGGVLFGQMVPRFDNRIIPLCRITGKKTPDRHCRAFYRYRWGMLMNNLRKVDPVTGSPIPLNAGERQKLHAVMEAQGYLTKTSLGKALCDTVGVEPANLEQLFLTPEMEKALLFDPVKRELNTYPLKEIWPHIPDRWQKIFSGELYKGKKNNGHRPTLDQWRQRLVDDKVDVTAFNAAVEEHLKKLLKRHKGSKKSPPTSKGVLARELYLQHRAEGRAPYSRKLMEKSWTDIISGRDPKSKRNDGSYGCLAETPDIVTGQWKRDIDKQTNNHLVRHRLKIFRKLLADMTTRYAAGSADAIDKIVIEVIRDLREFSGMTAKEKAQLLGIKLSDHRATVKWLEKQREETGQNFPINAGLIKKVRIARDMNWTCPFTNKAYCLQDILEDRVDREHIIPRSLRPSDSLESLVLTYRDINQWKGKRTAMKFIEETASECRTLSPAKFELLVKKLAVKGGSKDDERRRMRRKDLLLIRDYNSRDGEFTGRDLTLTSQLNKLAAFQVLDYFSELTPQGDASPFQPYQVIHLAGSVTATARRAWRLEGCLAKANPRILDESGKVRPKGEIREITHLHHSLDAVTLALASYYFPKNGRLWNLMSRRRLTDNEQKEMSGLLRMPVSFSHDGKFEFPDLCKPLKEQVEKRLTEKRIVMHLPSTWRGLRVQQNTWRVLGKDPKDPRKIALTQAMRDSATPIRMRKFSREKPSKLLGYRSGLKDGKLASIKGALVVEDNFGVALTSPEPQVIPYINVHKRLTDLKTENKGKMPIILRKGDIIHVPTGNYSDLSKYWRIRSIKDERDGVFIDMTFLDLVSVESKGYGIKRRVNLKTLLKNNLYPVKADFTGVKM